MLTELLSLRLLFPNLHHRTGKELMEASSGA